MVVAGFSLVLNICLVRPMLRSNHDILPVEVYIIFLVVAFVPLFLGSVADLVLSYFTDVLQSNSGAGGCFKQWFYIILNWITDVVYFAMIAMCYNRTYAIAKPFRARTVLTPGRSKKRCGVITAVTFLLRSIEVLGILAEDFIYDEEHKLCTYYPTVTKHTPYYWKSLICPILFAILYGLGWLFLLVLNIVLAYHLIFNARKWKREIPVHQVTSVMVMSVANLIIAVAHVANKVVFPMLDVGLRQGAKSTFSLELETVNMYRQIIEVFHMVSPLEYLMTAIFLISFTPEYKEKIASWCCCCCKNNEPNDQINPSGIEEVQNNTDKTQQRRHQRRMHEIEAKVDEFKSRNQSIAPIEGNDVLITVEVHQYDDS